jgi:hypothetical protein
MNRPAACRSPSRRRKNLMNDSRKDLHHDRTPTGHLDEAAPESRRPATGHDQPAAGTARAAGLEPGGATTVSKDREISGDLDGAVDAPDHDVTRDKAGRR